MDFEAFLRANPLPSFTVSLNGEGRVELAVDQERFIVVENTVIHRPAPQRVAAEGFDSHKGMGAK